MKFTILTIFPEVFDVLKSSILKRAEDAKRISIDIVNFRDYSTDKHKKVDDTLYGGGKGMLLMCQPIYDAINKIDPKRKALRIYTSPKGIQFNQKIAQELSTGSVRVAPKSDPKKFKEIIILCGHYEGVDQRVIDLCIDLELSLGEFVMTGGEIAAMAFVDAIARLLVLDKEATDNESHSSNYLEEPQYTKPREFMGLSVPEVLANGNHKEIEKWKKENRKTKS